MSFLLCSQNQKLTVFDFADRACPAKRCGYIPVSGSDGRKTAFFNSLLGRYKQFALIATGKHFYKAVMKVFQSLVYILKKL